MPFSKKTTDFLFENRVNDSKEWYNEHREEYKQYVQEPFAELITELQPTLNKIDAQIICNPKRISRLYRDARFSAGKSVFRENVWCVLGRHREVYEDLPCFYIDISPNGLEYGCGYYKAPAGSMDIIREMILSGDSAFKAALEAYEAEDYIELYGELYKRNRYPERSAAECNWLNRRTMGVSVHSTDEKLIFGGRLGKRLAEDFMKIAPIYDFFMKAERLRIEKEMQANGE